MSTNPPPGAASPSRPHLEQSRKRAKELLRAHRRGDPAAVARVTRVLGPSRTPKLADAQHVVAMEAGFPSWTRLKLHAVHGVRSREELLAGLIAAGLAGQQEAILSALALAPALPQSSSFLAVVLADEPAALGIAAGEIETLLTSTRADGSTLTGSPLAYLCHATFGRERREERAARARIARHLLAHGADPNECVDDPGTPGGKLSVLSAAARFTASVELVDELLRAGAVLEPAGSTAGPPAPPLVGAALGGSLDCVRRLLLARPPAWQAREALEVAIERNDPDMARALLAYGCIPDQAGRWRGRGGGCLHAALALGRDAAFLELLLDGGATPGALDRDGRSPLSIALQLGDGPAVTLLSRHTAPVPQPSSLDRLIAACFCHDRERVRALLAAEPELTLHAWPSDHQNVCRAVRRRDPEALAELLHAGFDANTADDDGQTALHLAVLAADPSAAELLLSHGASPHRPNCDNRTALELAYKEGKLELASLLAATEHLHESEFVDADELVEAIEQDERALHVAFEQAVTLMAAGQLDALALLFDRVPRLPSARSSRYHRATLLHYLGNNGTERTVAPTNLVAIAELLLERGAQVDASCHMYGGGPLQTTLGLASTSDQGVYPPGTLAGLIGVLVRGGARIHEANGRSSALEGAIMYGAVTALEALARGGARAYDLSTAAALADLSAVEAFLPAATEEQRTCACENAAAFGRLAVLELLLEAGADLDARGAYGGTALHKAAAANMASSVRWLLDHGADPLARDREHQGTPADWARHFGSREALDLLTAAIDPPAS